MKNLYRQLGASAVMAITCASNMVMAMDLPRTACNRFEPRLYSDFNYNEDEGEASGIMIEIIPFTGGEKVLWRRAEVSVDEPMLLDLEENGGKLFVEVPWGEQKQRWLLIPQGNRITIVGPNQATFKLKPVGCAARAATPKRRK
ncbi:MAG TPA: hypothetical protein VFF16_14900 [Telluria sp.]|nr:hypothetical protein [Telluria sp.]